MPKWLRLTRPTKLRSIVVVRAATILQSSEEKPQQPGK